MNQEQSFKILKELGFGNGLTPIESLTSSVTTSWGVNWDEDYIARDIMQNFFDANKKSISKIKVNVDGNNVTVSAPARFNILELFYIGSYKNDEDVGQYGEGFKAAAMCLLRDFDINPIAISGNQVLYIRISENYVEDTPLRPIIYDFFHTSEEIDGSQLILRNCSKQMIKALQEGLMHFFYRQNPLLGKKLWSHRNDDFIIYSSTSSDGYVFYRNLKRGEIPQIPLVLVINKKYLTIENKIANDRDRNAFGEKMMRTFYAQFSRGGVKHDVKGQKIIVEAAHHCWMRGHALLSEVADQAHRWSSGSKWPNEITKKVFGDRYFARSHCHDSLGKLGIQKIENKWESEGKQALPSYFKKFGLITAEKYIEAKDRKALDERKSKEQRNLTECERNSINVLSGSLRKLAPDLMNIYEKRKTIYSVADTETLLGELKSEREYRSSEVFFSSKLFLDDFAKALAVFLHEHAHIFGYDGTRKFTDALTELIESVVRNRQFLIDYENDWLFAQKSVIKERSLKSQNKKAVLNSILASKKKSELLELLKRIPEYSLLEII